MKMGKIWAITGIFFMGGGFNLVHAEDVHIEIKSTVNGSSHTVVSNTSNYLSEEKTNGTTTRTLIENNNLEQKKMDLHDRKEEMHQGLLQNKDEIGEKIASRQAQMREKMAENKKKKIESLYSLHLRRLLIACDRMTNILGRIDSRADKIASQEKNDVSEIKTNVAELKNNVQELKSNINKKLEAIDLVLESDDPKTMFVVLREEVEGYRENLQTIFSKIRALIPALEKLHSNTSPTPTPTAN